MDRALIVDAEVSIPNLTAEGISSSNTDWSYILISISSHSPWKLLIIVDVVTDLLENKFSRNLMDRLHPRRILSGEASED